MTFSLHWVDLWASPWGCLNYVNECRKAQPTIRGISWAEGPALYKDRKTRLRTSQQACERVYIYLSLLLAVDFR